MLTLAGAFRQVGPELPVFLNRDVRNGGVQIEVEEAAVMSRPLRLKVAVAAASTIHLHNSVLPAYVDDCAV